MNTNKFLLITILLLPLKSATIYGQQTQSNLNSKQLYIVSISALTAKGDMEQLKISLEEALNKGLKINEIREVFVHLSAYAGFPRSLQGINAMISIVEKRKATGIKDSVGREASHVSTTLSKYEQGKINLESLTGQPERNPKTGYAAFAPIIDTFLKEHLFADIFSRDILTYSERELVTIAALASMGGVEPMLRSHINIALRLGFTETSLLELFNIIEKKIGREEAEAGTQVLFSVTKPGVLRKDIVGSKIDTGLYKKGVKAPSTNFTGVTWVNMIVPSADGLNCSTGVVTFEPGSRTAWHRHPGGQILLITEGKGFYQERGRQRIAIKKGDVISCIPGTEHWHGASPNSPLTHIAIGPNADKGAAIWLEKVSEKEYLDNK